MQGFLMFSKIIDFCKKQPVLIVATIAMIITCIFVHVDSEYLDYFNFRTLATLFCTLEVVNAFSHIHMFEKISRSIVARFHNLRKVTLALVFITYLGSMFLANDMALLTFLPLGYFVLQRTNHKEAMSFTFIMQNIAANLGGMVTPFGNPQNLYLYSYYNISNMDFIKIMLPSFLMATVLIFIVCLFVKPIPLEIKDYIVYPFRRRRTYAYSFLFICSLLIVFRFIPCLAGTIAITITLFFLDKDAIKEVNYPLLLTFCVFFVFSGNMARLPAINSFFSEILPKNTLLYGILSCQFISNVPTAVLLSHFTTDYKSLLPAVNIGGCGTIIASLASLITFSEYKKANAGKISLYLIKFSLLNFGFVIILYFLQYLIIN
ncbi:MAG: citrate transporter [Treponema sp.]|nr:citrate transporter [Treponema sp.]